MDFEFFSSRDINFSFIKFHNTWPIWEFLIYKYNKEPVSIDQVRDCLSPLLVLNKRSIEFYIYSKE